MNNEIILYQPNETIKLEVRLENESVWLSRNQIATLFERDVKTIGKHIANALKEELCGMATVANFAIVQTEGNRKVVRNIEHYNLDMVLSIGYRVKSQRGILFRQWANTVLKEFVLKGYAVNQRLERIEHRIMNLEERQNEFDLMVKTSLPPSEGLFFNGQIYDAFECVRSIIVGASLKDLGRKWFGFTEMDSSNIARIKKGL